MYGHDNHFLKCGQLSGSGYINSLQGSVYVCKQSLSHFSVLSNKGIKLKHLSHFLGFLGILSLLLHNAFYSISSIPQYSLAFLGISQHSCRISQNLAESRRLSQNLTESHRIFSFESIQPIAIAIELNLGLQQYLAASSLRQVPIFTLSPKVTIRAPRD